MSQNEVSEVGNNLECDYVLQTNGVVAFVREGRYLNRRIKPGDEVNLCHEDVHVGVGRVLSVQVSEIGDVPNEILAYNQDEGSRTQEQVRFAYGVNQGVQAEITVALVDVTGLTAHVDENELSPHAYAVTTELQTREDSETSDAVEANEAAQADLVGSASFSDDEVGIETVTEDDELDEAEAPDGPEDEEEGDEQEDDAEDLLEQFDTPGGN